jgi:hypothetical protein
MYLKSSPYTSKQKEPFLKNMKMGSTADTDIFTGSDECISSHFFR